ncbi:hypothetical protein T484DRAFT_2138919 [Baffinella frigidus]|nr:hypothetical protein T484DRAFT_2138919 [Cryptophyta sp. CCMP2293]
MLSAAYDDHRWDEKLVLQVGAALIKILLDRATVYDLQSRSSSAALSHSIETKGGTGSKGGFGSIGMIRMEQNLVKMLTTTGSATLSHCTRHLPMLVPPMPWRGIHEGCYLKSGKLSGVVAMRIRYAQYEKQTSFLQTGNLTSVYAALDVLSSTSWRINLRLFAVVQKAVTKGMVIADLPSQVEFDVGDLQRRVDEEDDPFKLRELWRELRRTEQKNRDTHSLRCSLINQLHVAGVLADHERFYFPHNLDFRGRAYPIPPHLNHLGSDICRGLLKFAEAKPLGTMGLFWLKVHLANLFGVNKLSFVDRIAWVEARLEVVSNTAAKPFAEESLAFWLAADDPWQALATCMELTEALASPDPTLFLSDLPVHMDGSCNGLQHYAALGLDEAGGTQVNLVPGEKPGDPYTQVCSKVNEVIELHVADPNHVDYLVASVVRGKVTRKVVKQTVMTTVYGVTFIGAKDQVENRLREAYGESGSKELSDEEVSAGAGYIARLTLDCVGTIFTGAKTTMGWLSMAAKRCAATDQPIRWVTPMGLPVVQPYVKDCESTVKTIVQQVVLRTADQSEPEVNRQKQRTAFPPNFVHSLDSTHLLTSALDFHARGKTFAGVHDSYWTHACDYEELADVLRDQFVKLYSEPVLANLKRDLERDYGVELDPLPEKGTLDLEVVRKSPYFFS